MMPFFEKVGKISETELIPKYTRSFNVMAGAVA